MKNIELENVSNNHDYWCDAFISYAEHDDGTPLTEDELESIDSETVYEAIINYLY